MLVEIGCAPCQSIGSDLILDACGILESPIKGISASRSDAMVALGSVKIHWTSISSGS